MRRFFYFIALTLVSATIACAQVTFTKSIIQTAPDEIIITFHGTIQKGWHVYAPTEKNGPIPISFNIDSIVGAKVVGDLKASRPATQKYEEMFGAKVSFYEDSVTFTQKLKLTSKTYNIEGYLEYGACNEQNCMPPTSVNFKFEKKESHHISSTQVDENEAKTNAKNLWSIFLLGILGGLIAILTPCVWPIIPMTVSFFLKRGSKAKGIRDAIIYGISIIVIYLTLGLSVTAIFGASALNALSTNAVFNIFFFLVLVVFGASFLGGFEITLPSSWNNAVDRKASTTSGLISIFLMAFTLVLVSFSCTGPIIGFLLVEMGTSGNIGAPAIGMFGFALALALPFTLFAIFPTWLKSAPKSGSWMNNIKVCLGFVELAFSLKFLSVADLAYGWHILDREVFLSLWIILFAMLGCYLIGWIRFPHDQDDKHYTGVTKFFLAVCSFAFALYMVPGLWGAPCKAISAFTPPMTTQDFTSASLDTAKSNANYKDYDLGMAAAKLERKPVLIDFTGFGCVNCRKMEAAVWTDETVKKIIRDDYVLIQLFVDDKSPLPKPIEVTENGQTRKLRTVGDKWSYLQRTKFGSNTQPFYVLLDNNGKTLNTPRSYDEDIQKYIEFLETGKKNYMGK